MVCFLRPKVLPREAPALVAKLMESSGFGRGSSRCFVQKFASSKVSPQSNNRDHSVICDRTWTSEPVSNQEENARGVLMGAQARTKTTSAGKSARNELSKSPSPPIVAAKPHKATVGPQGVL